MPHGFDWASLMMTWGHLGHYLGTTWGWLGDYLATTLAKLGNTLAVADSGRLWHTLAYSVILWHTLAYSGILWHTLAYSGILLHALAYSGIINASLITADGAYHCPVGSIWPFLIEREFTINNNLKNRARENVCNRWCPRISTSKYWGQPLISRVWGREGWPSSSYQRCRH